MSEGPSWIPISSQLGSERVRCLGRAVPGCAAGTPVLPPRQGQLCSPARATGVPASEWVGLAVCLLGIEEVNLHIPTAQQQVLNAQQRSEMAMVSAHTFN